MSHLSDSDAAIEQLLAKQALHELVTGYSRAVDRLDLAAFVELFHADAVIDSGVVRGAPAYFAQEFDHWVRGHARILFHAVTNEWFRIDGERAIGESYVLAVVRLRGDSGERDMLTVGRYLDRFELRELRWKFSERRFVLDHNITLTDGGAPLIEAAAADGLRGTFGTLDPIYRFWGHPERPGPR